MVASDAADDSLNDALYTKQIREGCTHHRQCREATDKSRGGEHYR